MNLEQAWETEMIATALYLHSNQDSQVRDAMHYLEQVATPIKKGLVQNALEIAQKYEIGDLLRVGKEGDRAQDPRCTIREIRARQGQGLGEEREWRKRLFMEYSKLRWTGGGATRQRLMLG